MNQKVKIDQENQVMDLWHFESTFYIYMFGMILSFLVFVYEKSRPNMHKDNKMK